nr:reverse transcriptase domain-containing protein [Tanacetum cinerariifolium]
MSTRLSARNLFPPLDNPELTIRRRSLVDPTLLNDFEMATDGNGDLPVLDLQTMKELCQPTLNGQNSYQFHGLPGDDANKHLDKFLHVTQSIKVNGVTDDALRLYTLNWSFIINKFPNHRFKNLPFVSLARYGLPIKAKPTLRGPPLAKPRKYMLREPVKVVILTNLKEDLKGITNRSGTAYKAPTIPTTSSSPHKVVERETETKRALIDVYAGELTIRVNNEAVTFNLDQTLRYSTNYKDMTANRIGVIDMACEEYSQEVLGFSDVVACGNPIPYDDPIVSTSSLTLTPFGDSDFLLEEVDAFLALEDDPTSPKVDHSYYDTKGDILLLEAFLNDNPSLPPPTQGMWHVCIDYRKLNEATRKDHFPLSFMDQMLERLAGNEYYCFLDGFSGYFQIPINLKDQEKTTFMCPYGMLPTIACLSGYVMHQARSKGLELPVPSLVIAVRTSAMTSSQRSCLSTMSLTVWLPRITHKQVAGGSIKSWFKKNLGKDEKTKRIHDSKIKDRVFNVNDRVLFFNSRLKIFSCMLKTCWSGPFTITQVFPYGTIELSQTDMPNFKVNGYRLKHYFGEDIPKMVVSDLQSFPKDQ